MLGKRNWGPKRDTYFVRGGGVRRVNSFPNPRVIVLWINYERICIMLWNTYKMSLFFTFSCKCSYKPNITSVMVCSCLLWVVLTNLIAIHTKALDVLKKIAEFGKKLADDKFNVVFKMMQFPSWPSDLINSY